MDTKETKVFVATLPSELQLNNECDHGCNGDGCNSDSGGCNHDAGCGQDC